jgi:hypothetical protein
VTFRGRVDAFERQLGDAAARIADNFQVMVAEDFLIGGCPTTAEAYDQRGTMLATFSRLDDESFDIFHKRVKEAARRLRGASRLKIGGLAQWAPRTAARSQEPIPRGAVTLPEIPPHPSQMAALDLIHNHRRTALVAGRRWGKTSVLTMLAVDAALAGRNVGVFAPTFRFLGPVVEPIVAALRAVPNISINRSLGEIRLPGGGALDTWSLDHTARAGRGRRYHLALIDESGFDEDRLGDAYPFAIMPSLLDFRGATVTASTPNGLTGWLYDVVHDPRHGFVTHHAPSSSNPFLSPEEIAEQRASMPRPETALQEFDAVFLDTAGSTIFPLSLLLIDGEPHPDDFPCQAIGIAIDSNSGKGGPDRDGCAAVIFAVTLPGLRRGSMEGARVVLLDWDIQSLAQGGIVPWLAHMRERAMTWFRRLKPLGGPPRAYIEPAGNGYAVIEAARAQGLNPHEIDAKWVTAGKDARALMVEPHAAVGRVKIGRSALERRSNYRGVVANHLTRQVTGFKAFDKDAYRREDDLYDATMYSALVSIGDGTESRWSRLPRVA